MSGKKDFWRKEYEIFGSFVFIEGVMEKIEGKEVGSDKGVNDVVGEGKFEKVV